MTESPSRTLPSENFAHLKTLMLLRVIAVSIFMGFLIFFEIKGTTSYTSKTLAFYYALIAATYALTIVYAFLYKYSDNLQLQAYTQLLVDTFFITALVNATGGLESRFFSFYFLSIIYGSIILYKRGGMIIASSSSIFYGLIMDLHYYGLLHPININFEQPPRYEASFFLYMIIVNIAAFYFVAFLSGYISEQARKSRAELRVKQQDVDKLEALNELIIESISSALIALDDQNRIILFNPAAEQIFQIKTPDAIGSHIEDILPFTKAYLGEDGQLQTQNGTKPPNFVDLTYSGGRPEESHLRLSVSSLELPMREQKGCILIFQDMTEIKKIEEEMKKVEGLALIGELAAGIAHEIRSPLASISGSIQMLHSTHKESEVDGKLMNIISREIERLNQLVNDFLTFARPKNLNLQSFDLKQLILECLEICKKSQSWGGNLEVITDISVHNQIESDPDQIKQVLLNLFQNACEAMAGRGTLSIAADIKSAISDNSRKNVRITVRDTGPGIDEETYAKLFTPFFTTKKTGYGLGLATAKRITTSLGGKIEANNLPEGGAVFTFCIPFSSPSN